MPGRGQRPQRGTGGRYAHARLAAAPQESGEHSNENLTDLGYTEEKIAELRERNVI